MDAQTQAVLFHAVPLLVLAAVYGLLALVSVRRAGRSGVAVPAALSGAAAAGILGVVTLVEGEPLGGSVAAGAAAVVAGAVPALVVVWRRGRGAERAANGAEHARELGAVTRLSRTLVGADDVVGVASLLAGEACDLLSADLAALGVVDPAAGVVRMVHGRHHGESMDWLEGVELPLSGDPSGVASAVAAREAFAVVDARSSPRVSRALVERTGIRSAAFVPLLARDGATGVLVVASDEPRVFSFEELELLQTLASEAALAVERLHSAEAVAGALERERLIARIALALHSELDLDSVLHVAVREVGVALGLCRCLIRLGEPIAAEWLVDGFEPTGDRSTLLPVSNRAARERRTIAYADIAEAADLDPRGRELLLELGSRAVMATPIDVHGELIGVLALHRPEPLEWSESAVSLAEAVAREAGLAIHTARLLAENRRRLAEQAALLEASQALAGDLHFDTVIRRIVDEVCRLLRADAADCWILEESGRRLRCRAVRGLPDSEVGRSIPPEGTMARVIAERAPALKRRFAETEEPPPSPNFAVFAEVMEAPIAAGSEVRGVLGVCSLEHDRFSEEDLHLLHAFARLAAVALRNAESFEESARQAQVQRGFFRIASVLGLPLSATATLDAVAQAATEALGGDAAVVLRPVGSRLELAGGFELRPELIELLRDGTGEEVLVRAAVESQLLASSDVDEDERFAGWRAETAAAQAKSLLAVPVEEARGERGGLVIVVFFAGERSFADDDLELARQLAVAARGALERSELYEVERRARALAQALARTGRKLATELEPAAVLDELARQVTALLDADAASVRLLEGEELVLHSADGPEAQDVLGARSPSTAWIAGDIVQTREPAQVADARTDDRHVDADPLLAAGGYRAYVGVPLVSPEGAVQGVVAALSRRPRGWRREEVEALLALAGNASAAYSNAELYQRVALEKGQSEAILANVADGIVAVDRDGNVVLWNAAAERITGIPAGEALGRAPERVLGKALSTGDAHRVPGRLVSVRRGGEDVWLSLTEAVMNDPAGAVAGRIFAFRDISDERFVEQMKSEFVATVSHELRTPLTSIYGFAETLLREDVQFGEEERATFLRYIASESERLTTIVDTLLSVARLETGDVAVRIAPTDVVPVVTEAVRSVEASLGGNGHRFVADVPEEPLGAAADRDKLRQVLGILLDNAVRYSPQGGRVLVSARRAEDAVEVRVEDEGIGIPAAEQAHIFRKFYRGEAAGRLVGRGNTGLGLFIAEGLVTAMGGRIHVDSAEGRGSTFVLELPPARTEPQQAGV